MFVAEEAAGLFWPPDIVAGAFGEGFSVAMGTGVGNFGAAPPRIEGVMRPFDLRIFHYIDCLE